MVCSVDGGAATKKSVYKALAGFEHRTDRYSHEERETHTHTQREGGGREREREKENDSKNAFTFSFFLDSFSCSLPAFSFSFSFSFFLSFFSFFFSLSFCSLSLENFLQKGNREGDHTHTIDSYIYMTQTDAYRLREGKKEKHITDYHC